MTRTCRCRSSTMTLILSSCGNSKRKPTVPKRVRKLTVPKRIRKLTVPKQLRKLTDPKQVRKLTDPKQVRKLTDPKRVRKLAVGQTIFTDLKRPQCRYDSAMR